MITLTQLKREVSALCFDKSIAANESFCLLANRALRRIFSDRGVCRTVKLTSSPKRPSRTVDSFLHKGGSSVSFTANSASYLIETSGEGYFTVKDADGERKYDFNAEFTRHKGFLKGQAKLTFAGEFSYTVVRIAFFDRNFGSDEDSIPDGSSGFDLNEIFHDVICVTSLPTDTDGNPIYEARVEDGRIILPKDFSGDILVTYLRAPATISEDTPESPIDIGEDCTHLLPLLTASYLSLESDPERAADYYSLYKEEFSTVGARRRGISAAYRIGDGWS